MQVTTSDDDVLITSILDGDDQAFTTLVTRYQERVFRLLARFTRDRIAW